MKGVKNTLEFEPGRWTSFLTNGLSNKSRNHVACSTPKKSGSHYGKTAHLQWSSSPVLKNERLEFLPKSSNLCIPVLCSDDPAEMNTRQPSVGKNEQSQHSSLKTIDFEIESSGDELILPRSTAKKKLTAHLKKTDPIKSNEEIVNKRLNKGTVKQDENKYSTMKKEDTFSALTKGDTSNIFFEVVSSDEDLISNVEDKIKATKKLVTVKKFKKAGKESNRIQSKSTAKETNSAFQLNEWKNKFSTSLKMKQKHTKRAAMNEINKKSVSYNSQLPVSKTRSHGNEIGRSEERTEVAEFLASTPYSIPSRAKKTRAMKSPKSNTLEVGIEEFENNKDNLLLKRVSFLLPNKDKSTLNVFSTKTKSVTKKNFPKQKLTNSTPTMTENERERRRSSRPRATPRAYWLGDRAVHEDAVDRPSTNKQQESHTKKTRNQLVKENTKKYYSKRPGNSKKIKSIAVTEKINSSIIQTDCLLGLGIDNVDFCSDEEGESNGSFFARSLYNNSMESGFIKLLGGASTANLISTDHNKFYTVLENTVSLTIDGITKEFGRYDQFYVNKGVAHKILNKSNILTSLLQYVILH